MGWRAFELALHSLAGWRADSLTFVDWIRRESVFENPGVAPRKRKAPNGLWNVGEMLRAVSGELAGLDRRGARAQVPAEQPQRRCDPSLFNYARQSEGILKVPFDTIADSIAS